MVHDRRHQRNIQAPGRDVIVPQLLRVAVSRGAHREEILKLADYLGAGRGKGYLTSILWINIEGFVVPEVQATRPTCNRHSVNCCLRLPGRRPRGRWSRNHLHECAYYIKHGSLRCVCKLDVLHSQSSDEDYTIICPNNPTPSSSDSPLS